MMKINLFIIYSISMKACCNLVNTMSHIRPSLVCKDGVSLRVQASQYHYSKPRKTLDQGWDQYEKVEVRFPKGVESMPESWLDYSEDGTLQADVYAYVPVALVKEFIKSHGGLA